MLATLVIVLREVIEAGLIVGIVLAATKGVPGRGRWIAYGIVAGLAGACVVAGFAGQIAELFEGAGQELFNAGILLLAVGMLTWHNAWMASHGRALAEEVKRVGASVAAGERPPMALAVVCFAAVLREGSEVVLFLYGVALSGGSTAVGMMTGGVLGLAAGAALSALLYLGLLSIPARHLFRVTSWLITLLAAGLAAQAIVYLQQAGYIEAWSAPVWDTSWLLSSESLIGRLLHTLVGYTDQPNGAQLGAYLLTVVVIVSAMRFVGGRAAAAQRAAQLRREPAAG